MQRNSHAIIILHWTFVYVTAYQAFEWKKLEFALFYTFTVCEITLCNFCNINYGRAYVGTKPGRSIAQMTLYTYHLHTSKKSAKLEKNKQTQAICFTVQWLGTEERT